jgi:hypothetical protein
MLIIYRQAVINAIVLVRYVLDRVIIARNVRLEIILIQLTLLVHNFVQMVLFLCKTQVLVEYVHFANIHALHVQEVLKTA